MTYGGRPFAISLGRSKSEGLFKMNGKRRILVVDDDAEIRGLVRNVLERVGYEVSTARDGAQAIDLLAKSDYDVVLLDVMMPGLSGLEVVESLRRDNSAVLAHTYLLTASLSKRFEQLPVRGIIEKPFDIHDLVAETKDCIGH
jgi:CheY-like chemotaxis protein